MVGLNCGRGPKSIMPLMKKIRDVCKVRHSNRCVWLLDTYSCLFINPFEVETKVFMFKASCVQNEVIELNSLCDYPSLITDFPPVCVTHPSSLSRSIHQSVNLSIYLMQHEIQCSTSMRHILLYKDLSIYLSPSFSLFYPARLIADNPSHLKRNIILSLQLTSLYFDQYPTTFHCLYIDLYL